MWNWLNLVSQWRNSENYSQRPSKQLGLLGILMSFYSLNFSYNTKNSKITLLLTFKIFQHLNDLAFKCSYMLALINILQTSNWCVTRDDLALSNRCTHKYWKWEIQLVGWKRKKDKPYDRNRRKNAFELISGFWSRV